MLIENRKPPIATPRIAFRPKIMAMAVPKPIAGKKGGKLISLINIDWDNLANRKYKIAVKATILPVELR